MSSTNTLQSTVALSGTGVLGGALSGTSQKDSFTIGSGAWPALSTAFTTGSSDTPSNGIGYANQWFVDQRTLSGVLTVSGATNATPIVLTTGTHALADGDPVTVASVGGNTNANGNYYAKVTGYSATTFALYSDSALTTPVAGNSGYTSGGTVVTYHDLDLAGGVTNHLTQICTFTKVKQLIVVIVDADGIKKLRVGPQNATNAFVGPFGGAGGATIYKVVDDWEILINNKWAGYAVGAGATDVLRINNPGAASVTYLIAIQGVQ